MQLVNSRKKGNAHISFIIQNQDSLMMALIKTTYKVSWRPWIFTLMLQLRQADVRYKTLTLTKSQDLNNLKVSRRNNMSCFNVFLPQTQKFSLIMCCFSKSLNLLSFGGFLVFTNCLIIFKKLLDWSWLLNHTPCIFPTIYKSIHSVRYIVIDMATLNTQNFLAQGQRLSGPSQVAQW